MSYMKGDWDNKMDADAHLLRGLQNRQNNAPSNEPSPANGTVAILIVLLALFCFLWAPRNLRRCSSRNRSGNNNTTADGRRHPSSLASGDALSPQEVEIALVESSLRTMMASMSTMMEAQAWGNSLGINMTSGDRREYIANVLMTKKVVVMSPGESPLEQAPDNSKGDLLITAPSPASDEGDENDNNTNDDHGEDHEQCAICLVEYEAGDEISWSHNKSCTHAFHRECIIDWLISHDECPCCRHNYLSLCDDDDDNNVVEGGGAAGAAAEEGRNRTRAPVPVPLLRDQGDQLVRGLQMLYEFSRVPSFPSHALLGTPNDGANLAVRRNEQVDSPVEDASGQVEQNGQMSPDRQANAADVETGMASPAVERAEAEESEMLVQDETQTAITAAPEQAVDANSSELNEGSGGSVVHVPDVLPVASSGPSANAEQRVTESVEDATSAGRSEVLMRIVQPELGQAEGEINNRNPNEGETAADE